MSLTAAATPSISVNLTTSTEFILPDTHYILPASFSRFQLSLLLNKVLSLPTSVPFDFLINGELLRSSLSDYLRDNQKTVEDVLTIEYIQSSLPPKLSREFNSDDWISSVSISGQGNKFLTGNYDNAIRIFSPSSSSPSSSAEAGHSSPEFTVFGHSGPVSGVTWFPSPHPQSESEYTSQAFASCSHDRTARLWFTSEQGQSAFTYSILTLHTDAINSVSASRSGAFILTAGSDGLIGVFSSAKPEQNEADQEQVLIDGKKKRRKIAPNALDIEAFRKAPEQVLTNHTGRVTRAAYCNNSESAAYSAGWDCTVRTWDVESGVNDTTKQASSVVRAITHMSSPQVLLATGHADRLINIWDIRSEVHNVSLTLPSSHKSHITALSAHPTSQHHLASASLDGTVKMWDLRSSKAPLFDLDDGGDKPGRLLGMDWNGDIIATGGEDRKLRIWQGRIKM